MTQLRCPVCQGTQGRIRFITAEQRLRNGEAVNKIDGTDGWVGGTREAARLDVEGACGHNWSVLIGQNDLELRYRVYQDEQKPEGPFMPRGQANAESSGKLADRGQEACSTDAAPSMVGVKRGGAKAAAHVPRKARSEASKVAASQRLKALWAQARAEGRERPGGPIRKQPEANSDE